MNRGIINNSDINSYSEMVVSAIELGVSLNDLMMETARYHGREFTNCVLKRVIDMM